jgi:hypothetical protein
LIAPLYPKRREIRTVVEPPEFQSAMDGTEGNNAGKLIMLNGSQDELAATTRAAQGAAARD